MFFVTFYYARLNVRLGVLFAMILNAIGFGLYGYLDRRAARLACG